MHLVFFHGRDTAEEDMNGEWGYDGPVIKDIGLQVTYGNVRIINNEGDEVDLTFKEGCVEVDGKFYGDWYLVDTTSFKEIRELRESGRQFLTFDEFRALTPDGRNTKQSFPMTFLNADMEQPKKKKTIRSIIKKKKR